MRRSGPCDPPGDESAARTVQPGRRNIVSAPEPLKRTCNQALALLSSYLEFTSALLGNAFRAVDDGKHFNSFFLREAWFRSG